MVGSWGSGERSKDAEGMMALHEALRSVCLNSDWIYSVFWTIRPRPRVRGGNGCKVGDDSGTLMLMWEDGYCGGRAGDCLEDIEGEDTVRKAFSKMSIQLYNYGEGLMGKVASDKCHKWVFKEPAECEPNISNYWQSSFDALPPEWTDQFESGIQTIAVIQAGHGLLQLGSCKIMPEDLHFVLRMRHTFESLGYQSNYYLSQLFSSNQSASLPTAQPSLPPFNRGPHPRPFPPSFHNPAARTSGFPNENNIAAAVEHESDIKRPKGLSLFDSVSGRANDTDKLLFNSESLGDQRPDHRHPTLNNSPSLNEFLSSGSASKYMRSLTLPARVDLSSSSTSIDHHHAAEYRNSGPGMYPHVMDPFLD